MFTHRAKINTTRFAAVLFAIALSMAAYATKSKKDTLIASLKIATHDTSIVRINNDLSELLTKIKPDSAYFYVNNAILTAKKNINSSNKKTATIYKKELARSYTLLGNYYKALGDYGKAINNYIYSLNIKKKLEDSQGKAKSYIDLGIIKSIQGKYFEALDYYEFAKKILEKTDNEKLLAKLYRNIGNVYYYQGEWDFALESYLKSLALSEKIKDFRSVSRCQNNIAMIHKETNRFSWAIDYLNKSLKIKEEINDQRGIATVYNNMGGVYFKQKKYSKALEYYYKSLEIRHKVRDKRGTAFSLTNIGKLMVVKKNYAKADDYYVEALAIFREIEDKEQIASVYNEIAKIKYIKSDYDNAIKYSQISLKIASDLNALPRLRDSYKLLSESYEQQYNISLAFKYFKLYFDNYKMYIAIKDSIFDKEANDLIKKEQRYRIDRKEAENRNLKLQQEKQKADERNLKMQMYFLLLGFAVVIVFAIIIFRNYKSKIRANNLLRKQKEQLQNAKEEIEVQKQEIEASIVYAQNIQKAVLPSKELRKEILPEHFVFFRPRNIVSGDFFWLRKIDKYLVVSVADCTGHGVPGAFMSMLGFMFLNEVVTLKNIHNAGLILDKVREKVKESLHQSGKEGEAKDGMDMSFYIINTETNELNYAGAFNPLYIIRDNNKIDDIEKLKESGVKIFKPKKANIDASLIEIKADRQPIAIYSYEKAFTNHRFQLQKGDRLYSFSDGYPDQFGGENGKKFNAKRFKELLLDIRNNDMESQKKIINDNFIEWMGDIEQVDDVILLGLKI